MTYPKLPAAAPGEVLLICTCYEDDSAQWDEILHVLDGRLDGEVVVVGDGRVPLRPVENPAWDDLHGGNLPALLPDAGAAPPVIAVVDIPVVYGDDDVLLVDLRDVPGRGVRVPAERLGPVLENLLDGTLRFDELVRAMDRFGVYGGDLGAYGGDLGAPAVATPTTVLRASFPQLPASDTTLLVRTDFADEEGWRVLLEVLGEPDEDGELSTGGAYYENLESAALVVDDRAFEGLQPGQVPALVPPDEHATMVALADATTMKDPTHPLFVVDLYDTPGQATRIPFAEAGSMAVNLEIANMDFADFV